MEQKFESRIDIAVLILFFNRPKMLSKVFEQVKSLSVDYLNDEVVSLEKKIDEFVLNTKNNGVIFSKNKCWTPREKGCSYCLFNFRGNKSSC